MYVQYGSYQFDANNVAVTLTQRRNFARRGEPVTITKQMTLDGILLPDSATQASIKTKIDAFEDAFAEHGEDLGLYHDDGSVSAHFLDSSASLGGVRIIDVSYPDGDGRSGQYATRRSFRVTAEAEFSASSDGLVIFRETLQFIGSGGIRDTLVETRTGIPQRQIISLQTPQTIIQSGSSVGLEAYVNFPAPIFPGIEQHPQRRLTNGDPERIPGGFRNWPRSWQYTFLSETPLFSNPNMQ